MKNNFKKKLHEQGYLIVKNILNFKKDLKPVLNDMEFVMDCLIQKYARKKNIKKTLNLDFKKKYSSKNFILYSFYAIFIWIINWFTIYFINFYFNINKNLIAILILPILVIFSYLVQKNIIFKNKN